MCDEAKNLMNADTKIFLKTDLIIQSWDFRANFPIPSRTGLLICDQIIQYQYWAFFETRFFDTYTTRSISHVHVLLKIFHDEIFRSKFPIPILRLFSETKYVLILIQSLFRQPNFQIPILIPWKKLKRFRDFDITLGRNIHLCRGPKRTLTT